MGTHTGMVVGTMVGTGTGMSLIMSTFLSGSPVASAIEEIEMADGMDMYMPEDFPTAGAFFDNLDPFAKKVIAFVTSTRCVVRYNSMYLVFSTNTCRWVQLMTKEAAEELCKIMDINAPVNYEVALARFHPLIKNIARDTLPITKSVCISTHRYRYTTVRHRGEVYVHFIPHPPVILGNTDPETTRKYQLVTNPIDVPMMVKLVRVKFDSALMRMILLPLRHDQRLDFLWRIGNVLRDPIRRPTVVVLYGAYGREGKSTMVSHISNMLPGAMTFLSGDVVGKKSKLPTGEELSNMVNARIVVCDEVKTEDGFDYNNIKRITSGTEIDVGGTKVVLEKMVIGTTNRMGFFERAAVNDSVGRRLIIYTMHNTIRNMAEFKCDNPTDADRLSFTALCLAVADTYKDPPTSIYIALFTMFRKATNRIAAGLIIDHAATPTDCKAATSMLAIRSGTTYEDMVGAFYAISPVLVGLDTDGIRYVKSIRCRAVIMTPDAMRRIKMQTATYHIDMAHLAANVTVMK